MGRLWQTLILMNKYSVFEFLPFEALICNNQGRLEYFISLNKRDFSRIDYMNVFKNISSAKASRD